MDVGVHQARHHYRIASIDQRRAGRPVIETGDGRDPPIPYMHRRRVYAVRPDNSPALNYKVSLHCEQVYKYDCPISMDRGKR